MKSLSSASCFAILLACGAAQAEVPRVAASIAPIHSLVASVMRGLGEPELIVPAEVSDHDYALKPSDLRKIASADLVVWVGESLETYLADPLETEGVTQLELLAAPGVDPHPYGQAGAHAHADEDADAADDHGHADHAAVDEGHAHDHSAADPHVWLDPVRAEAIVEAVAERLAEMDAANAGRYRQNAMAAVAELQALDAEIGARLAPLAEKPFITFHDGYSYFVERYQLNQVGALSIHPESRTGAATISALRAAVAAEGVACAFAEPQFDPGVVETLAGEAGIKIGVLDALGSGLQPGAPLYISLMRRNAEAVETCLSSTS